MASARRTFRSFSLLLAAGAGLLACAGLQAAAPGAADPASPRAGLQVDGDPLRTDGLLKERAYRLWKDSGCGFKNTEHAAWIVGNVEKEVALVKWPSRGMLKREVWTGTPPPRLVGIVHTHPDSVDPRPSDKDVAAARSLGVPNYAVSRQGIWKATPAGEIVKVDGEAWIVRCAGVRGCGAGEPSRAMAERLQGGPPETRDGFP